MIGKFKTSIGAEGLETIREVFAMLTKGYGIPLALCIIAAGTWLGWAEAAYNIFSLAIMGIAFMVIVHGFDDGEDYYECSTCGDRDYFRGAPFKCCGEVVKHGPDLEARVKRVKVKKRILCALLLLWIAVYWAYTP